MLLLLMVLPLLLLPKVPKAYTAFSGLPLAALVMSLLSMVLLSLPANTVVLLKKKIPAAALVEDPLIVQYFMVLELASLMNRMVDVPAVDRALVLVIVRLFVLPVAFTRPSMVTLSAPFRSMSGAASSPEMLNPVVVG